MAAERKKELIFILPAYRLCTAAGAGAVKFRGRVRTQEAHERPTDHHCYMYEYHTAAAVAVSQYEWYNDSSDLMILVHVTVVLCWLLVCFLCLNPTSDLNSTSTSCSTQPVRRQDQCKFFLPLCCHTELTRHRRIAKRVKATLT